MYIPLISNIMENKIVSALVKLSDTFRSLLWEVGKEEGLSPIQIKFLIYLKNHSENFCRTSQLAMEFSLTNATVSEAVNSLTQKELVCKITSNEDRRVSTLFLTPRGKEVVEKISCWTEDIRKHVADSTVSDKETVMLFLMQLIESLQRSGIISVAKMCTLCDNFKRNLNPGSEKPHYCKLIDKAIANFELNIDCENYQGKIKRDCLGVL